MPVYETFAERKRRMEAGGKPTVYCQDQLPRPFRIQVAHIWDGIVTPKLDPRWVWSRAHTILARELGEWAIGTQHQSDRQRCLDFMLYDHNVDNVLSMIELVFRLTENCPLEMMGSQSLDDAMDELNHRFRQHAIGYQFQGGKIISVESQYLHTETVEPAIQLLHDAHFAGPLQEFMQAHEHYRKGENTQAIANAQYAFESTMKAICDRRGWSYGTARATAKNLLDVLFSNSLIPTQMQSHFTALRSTLESGLPSVRNQPGQGGHGQGSDVIEVPDHVAAYGLHLAATNIVFLIEAHNATK